MEMYILLVIICVSNAVCFVLGARLGRGGGAFEAARPAPEERPAELPSESRKAQKAVETMLRNIDAYDGTGIGQEEV